eukprot:scaffold8626_cov225-Isochrysis_galbana.AAC.5
MPHRRGRPSERRWRRASLTGRPGAAPRRHRIYARERCGAECPLATCQSPAGRAHPPRWTAAGHHPQMDEALAALRTRSQHKVDRAAC